MLLTDNRAPPTTELSALLFLRAVARRVSELLALFHRGRLELRPDDLAHRRDPVRHDRPLLAVPLLEQHGAVPLVVLARYLHRVREALHAELFQPLVGEVQVLEAPPE